jgi:hypothetical protein
MADLEIIKKLHSEELEWSSAYTQQGNCTRYIRTAGCFEKSAGTENRTCLKKETEAHGQGDALSLVEVVTVAHNGEGTRALCTLFACERLYGSVEEHSVASTRLRYGVVMYRRHH